MMKRLLLLLLAVSALTLGCGGESQRPTGDSPPAVSQARTAAVELVLVDVAVTGAMDLLEPGVLRARFSRYVASDELGDRVRLFRRAIEGTGGSESWQPVLHSITVVDWEQTTKRRGEATVEFLGYEEIQVPRHRRELLPVERFKVTLREEAPGISGWRLVDYEKSWLGPEGPMAPGGTDGRSYPVSKTFELSGLMDRLPYLRRFAAEGTGP